MNNYSQQTGLFLRKIAILFYSILSVPIKKLTMTLKSINIFC